MGMWMTNTSNQSQMDALLPRKLCLSYLHVGPLDHILPLIGNVYKCGFMNDQSLSLQQPRGYLGCKGKHAPHTYKWAPVDNSKWGVRLPLWMCGWSHTFTKLKQTRNQCLPWLLRRNMPLYLYPLYSVLITYQPTLSLENHAPLYLHV